MGFVPPSANASAGCVSSAAPPAPTAPTNARREIPAPPLSSSLSAAMTRDDRWPLNRGQVATLRSLADTPFVFIVFAATKCDHEGAMPFVITPREGGRI